jgi:hypothetical protein
MGFQITQEALVYIVLMLAVIFIGVWYVTGLNPVDLAKGNNPFKQPQIDITEMQIGSPPPYCGSSSCVVKIDSLKIHYQDGKSEPVEIYLVLDIGNNPVLGDAVIKCDYSKDTKEYTCGDAAPLFTLPAGNVQDIKNMNKADTYMQIYFFKKADAIRRYLASTAPGRTTSSLLTTFNDFYLGSSMVGATINTGQMLGDVCSALDAQLCMSDEMQRRCYLDASNSCRNCRYLKMYNCNDFGVEECTYCEAAKIKNCYLYSGSSAKGCRDCTTQSSCDKYNVDECASCSVPKGMGCYVATTASNVLFCAGG